MLQALLNKNGAKKVDTAQNGLEAVHTALANPLKYDIIFMDNLMPVMVR
jgi:CheY-like chemotaxis protein